MIDCIIASSNKTTVYKDLQSVILPGFFGQIEILPTHTELFTLIKDGEIVIQRLQKKLETVKVSDGECYIKDDIVNIIL